MKKDYSKYIGKRMAWAKMQELFPERWVALSDYKFWYNPNKELKSGVIMAICTDEDDNGEIMKQILKSNPDIKLYWVRTTEGIGVDIIWEHNETIPKSV
jgi:hypothetical protein